MKKILFASVLALVGLNDAVQAQAVNPAPSSYAYGSPTSIYPYIGGLTGSYRFAVNSSVMAAGLSAASPIASFRYGGTGYAVIKNVTISAGNATIAFAAGVAQFNLFAARSFTASDSGGNAATLTGNNGKLRTSFATTAVADFRVSSTAALTPGTRTLDATALNGITIGTPANISQPLTNGTNLIAAQNAGDYPLVVANNEGFVIQTNVPATGNWWFTVSVEYDEYAAY